MVQTIHATVKGRARYKIQGLYRSLSLKKHLDTRLPQEEGIRSVSVNIMTGTILVLFNSVNTSSSVGRLVRNIVLEHNIGLPSPTGASRPPEEDRQQGRTGKIRKNRGGVPPASRDTREKRVRDLSRRKVRKLVIRAEEQLSGAWHAMEARHILALFGTGADTGLSDERAKEHLGKFGPNLLPESVPRSGLSILLSQFSSLPTALLGAAAGISLLTGGIADAVVILGVVAINAVIGYATESQAEKTIHSLKSLVRPSSLVLRDGDYREISADEVVPGDILVLRPGSYVAADSRLIEVQHLSIDESALTGESLPVVKRVDALGSTPVIPLGDRTNMVYMGTLVTGGQGLALVVATGHYTEIGRIQTLVGYAKPPETPMEKQLRRMGAQLVAIGGAVCGLVFLIGLLRGYGFLRMLKTSISLAVAAVPEGLPTIATTTLAIGIRIMRKHNVLIRHLDAVEALGSVQTICLDKTGTITLNSMSITAVHCGMRKIRVADGRFTSDGEDINPYETEELLRLIHITVLCNETEIIDTDEDPRQTPRHQKKNRIDRHILRGSPTENALIQMAVTAGIDVLLLRERYPLITMYHRSEKRNYMATLHVFDGATRMIALKGSPSEVLSLCKWHLREGEMLPLTEEDRLAVETGNGRMAGDALRILGVAYCIVTEDRDPLDIRNGFIWLGLIGMTDPLRKGVKKLIGSLHKAGIATVMITGDQSPTAYAIGKELNLSNGMPLEILDSTHLNTLEPGIMKALCERVHVFSRVSPSHKLQIVQALQGAGKVVAMTGDGINDGPALKAADIGIAMGHTGTDVAREVADMILAEDNLETMIVAVSHGRTIYNNIRKSVHFLLATNLSEIMVMFAAIAGGAGEPLNAMQLLWINLISDIFPGLALALEPPEPDVLSRPPRDPSQPIIQTSDFKRIALESGVLSASTLGAYGYGLLRYGPGPRAGTLAFMSLTSCQLLHALSCRSEEPGVFIPGGKDSRSHPSLPPNRYLNAALTGSFILQGLTLAVPGLRKLLGIGPIGVLDGIVAGGSALVSLTVNEMTKTRPLKRNAHQERRTAPTESPLPEDLSP
ncbi:MAG: cation-transporting P-type ATPase [Alphaproteobacteria bacterium]|uniref:Cation-transporting P-type ATPase n=1 Tax=Candidatus Nitrobium versatile TaxID=2884831 RepID=A0A953M3Y3_9BACT|nr:cation-transporting P-type ATPase [Candidatus Nitrobium versatile]